MSFSPIAFVREVAKVSLKADMCIVCRIFDDKRYVQNPDPGCLSKIHQLNGLFPSPHLNEETLETIQLKKASYHTEGFKTLCLKGKREENKKDKSLLTEKRESIGKPFTQSGTDQYDKTKCVICQEENDEAVHEVRSANRDAQLKGAFKKAPTATSKIKFRSERSRDDHAGDIKYHKSCRKKHIIRAKPELTANV